MLLPEIQVEILRLHFAGKLSYQQIAEQLGVDHETVAAVIERRRVPLSASEHEPRRSNLARHCSQIDALLTEDPCRSAVNILQHLRHDGYQGSITILREHLYKLRHQPLKEASFELDFQPGEAAQIDWSGIGDTRPKHDALQVLEAKQR